MDNLVRTKPYIPDADKKYILDAWSEILDSGMFIQGKYVSEFEQAVADYCGTKYAIATNSGATALEVAIRASGLNGCQILVPTQTFVASVSAIITSGNIPVITEIDHQTQCLTLDIIKRYVESPEYQIEGVMLVHMAGLLTPDIEEIEMYCTEHGIILIGDASHAMGSSIGNRKAGSFGDAECFSLFATKIITTGEGGIITTNDELIAEYCRLLRNHGCIRNDGKYAGLDYGVTCTVESSNYRMPEFAAVLGVSQMKRVDEFVNKRNELATAYYNRLAHLSDVIQLPNDVTNHQRMSWWQYIVIVKDPMFSDSVRELMCKELLDLGVPTANAYYPPCHTQPAFTSYIHLDQLLELQNSSRLVLNRHIALPMYVEMTVEQVNFVCDQLIQILKAI